MLFGREQERAAIDGLLVAARRAHSGALILRGAPGVGKTALLEDAAAAAGGMRVLRCVGAEAEAEADLAFAGLHQLLQPVAAAVTAVPAAQGAALRSALSAVLSRDGGSGPGEVA